MPNIIRSHRNDRTVTLTFSQNLESDADKAAAADVSRYSVGEEAGVEHPQSAEVTGDAEVTLTFKNEIGNRRFWS